MINQISFRQNLLDFIISFDSHKYIISIQNIYLNIKKI